jgi:prephenate dehydrogenase
MKALLAEIAPYLASGTIVTDAASTKADAERWALGSLPAHVRWVGSHPMAGKETAGLEHADAGLFRGRTWCIVPPAGADPDAVAIVTRLAEDTGARTMQIDAAAHDRAVAAVSHLPFTAAASLAQSVIDQGTFAEVAPVAGTGLRDMTRLASGDAVMHRDIVLTNRDNLIRELEKYAGAIQDTIALLQTLPSPDECDGDPAVARLGEWFARLKTARDERLAPPGAPPY